jgi:hypothetical protein
VPSRIAGWPVQNGLFWRWPPDRPDLLCPDGAAGGHALTCLPRLVGWTDGRHDRDVRLLQVRTPDLTGRLAVAGR